MSVNGWSKARGVALRAIDAMGHRIGRFRKNGRVGGALVHTARCRVCGCHVNLVRRGGRWLSDLRALSCSELRMARINARLRKRRDQSGGVV